MVCRVSSRKARAPQRNPVLKKQNQTKKRATSEELHMQSKSKSVKENKFGVIFKIFYICIEKYVNYIHEIVS